MVLGAFPTISPEAARKSAAKVLNTARSGTDPKPRPTGSTVTVAALAEDLFCKLELTRFVNTLGKAYMGVLVAKAAVVRT